MITTRAAVFERRDVKLSDIRGGTCAWAGCQAHFDGHDLPPGWTVFLLYRARRPILNFLEIPPQNWLRDTTLCPEHTVLLDRQLKELGRALDAPAQGRG
jgi:hypothetical protein